MFRQTKRQCSNADTLSLLASGTKNDGTAIVFLCQLFIAIPPMISNIQAAI